MVYKSCHRSGLPERSPCVNTVLNIQTALFATAYSLCPSRMAHALSCAALCLLHVQLSRPFMYQEAAPGATVLVGLCVLCSHCQKVSMVCLWAAAALRVHLWPPWLPIGASFKMWCQPLVPIPFGPIVCCY